MHGWDICQNPKKPHFGDILEDFLGPPHLTKLFFQFWASSLFLLCDFIKKNQKKFMSQMYRLLSLALVYKKTVWDTADFKVP